jgi:hypothetical protein
MELFVDIFSAQLPRSSHSDFLVTRITEEVEELEFVIKSAMNKFKAGKRKYLRKRWKRNLN